MALYLHSELGTRSDNSSDTTLEQGLETFFFRYRDQGVKETLVMRMSCSSLGLKTCLDTIEGCRQVGWTNEATRQYEISSRPPCGLTRWHSGYGSSQLKDQ